MTFFPELKLLIGDRNGLKVVGLDEVFQVMSICAVEEKLLEIIKEKKEKD
jgi:hypothetical protein